MVRSWLKILKRLKRLTLNLVRANERLKDEDS